MSTLIAAPVQAQTITAPGLLGQPACGSEYTHNLDGDHLSTNLGTGGNAINGAGTQGIWTNNFFGVTCSFLRVQIGGNSSVTSFPLKLRLVNSQTGSQVSETDLGTVTSANAVDRTNNQISVSAKTPYVAIYYADVTGLGVSNPINTICFMTGGTYTITTQNGPFTNFMTSVGEMFHTDNCTLDGQLGNEAARRGKAIANLNRIFESEGNYLRITSTATCDDKCDERFPRSDDASTAVKNACYDQCRAAASGIPSWATLVANEVTAIKRTFDPSKCAAPEANQPRTNGCYTISPRTPFDIKNCLCGRGSIFTDTDENTATRVDLGCDPN